MEHTFRTHYVKKRLDGWLTRFHICFAHTHTHTRTLLSLSDSRLNRLFRSFVFSVSSSSVTFGFVSYDWLVVCISFVRQRNTLYEIVNIVLSCAKSDVSPSHDQSHTTTNMHVHSVTITITYSVENYKIHKCGKKTFSQFHVMTIVTRIVVHTTDNNSWAHFFISMITINRNSTSWTRDNQCFYFLIIIHMLFIICNICTHTEKRSFWDLNNTQQSSERVNIKQ